MSVLPFSPYVPHPMSHPCCGDCVSLWKMPVWNQAWLQLNLRLSIFILFPPSNFGEMTLLTFYGSSTKASNDHIYSQDCCANEVLHIRHLPRPVDGKCSGLVIPSIPERCCRFNSISLPQSQCCNEVGRLLSPGINVYAIVY